jgi:hypothetical protein
MGNPKCGAKSSFSHGLLRKIHQNTPGMKSRMHLTITPKGKHKFGTSKGARPKMTVEIAELRAVGDPKGPMFDGAAFHASLKK